MLPYRTAYLRKVRNPAAANVQYVAAHLTVSSGTIVIHYYYPTIIALPYYHPLSLPYYHIITLLSSTIITLLLGFRTFLKYYYHPAAANVQFVQYVAAHLRVRVTRGGGAWAER